jgi:GGDEF domain-containing protein
VIDGHSVHPAASIGVGLISERTSRAADLLEAADMDMYRAKALGRRKAA